MRTLEWLFVTTVLVAITSMQACSTDIGGNEDRSSPVVSIDAVIDADMSDSDIIGEARIRWTSDEPNVSTVDIYLSTDSGANYDTAIVIDAPDIGEYVWDTNTVADCRSCRLSIVATDVVGNTGDAATSSADFVINNVPQLVGRALYYDDGNDGFGDNDTVIVSFDKDINIRAPVGRDFQLPVLADTFGNSARVEIGPASNQLTIVTIDNDGLPRVHMHIEGKYAAGRKFASAPSGVDIISNLPPGTIYAVDTERTAEPYQAIDIAPTFGRASQNLSDMNAKTVAHGDVDGDGDLDFVLGNRSSSPGNQVWLNDGAGNFTDSLQSLGNGGTYLIVLEDLDNDDDLDMVTANAGSVNRVWINQGGIQAGTAGQYLDSSQDLGNGTTYSIALADIDDDDDIDVVVGNSGEANTVWTNNGSGVFGDSGQMLGNSSTASIALGDVDGDGDPDIIEGNDGAANLVWLNNGSGVFTDSGQLLGNGATETIAAGDLDNDGDLDIVDNNWGQPKRIYLNDGDGIFTESGQTLGTTRTFFTLLGDVDNDGDLDVVDANLGVNQVWINDGNGAFANSGMKFGNEYSYGGSLFDIDDDGDYDLVTALLDSATNGLSPIWINSLNNNNNPLLVDSGQSLGAGYTFALDVADVDADGNMDFVAGNTSLNGASNVLWMNNGDGTFTDTDVAMDGSSSFSVEFGDLDGDGDLDLVSGNNDGVRVYTNTDTVFTLAGPVLDTNYGGYPNHTIGVARLGDIDGDDDLDIVTGSWYAYANVIWLNDGDGNFSDSGQVRSSESVVDLALVDVDNDDDLDIIDGEGGSYSAVGRPNRVWLNGGDNSGSNTGVFTDSGQLLGEALTMSIATGDIDGDGDIDFVAGNRKGGTTVASVVWVNNGSGGFSDSQHLGTDDSWAVTLADIDGDGDLDVVDGVDDETPDRIYINDGSGLFTVSAETIGSSSTHALASADIDGDGDVDIICGNTNEEGNNVWAADD